MNNIYSGRKIETACKRDINFMSLLKYAMMKYIGEINKYPNGELCMETCMHGSAGGSQCIKNMSHFWSEATL